MAENETKNIDENQKKFNKLVEIAEKYIKDNALKVLNAKRKSEDTKYTEAKDCYGLISSKYKPMYMINDDNKAQDNDYLLATTDSKYYEKDATTLKEKLLVRFCIQLQNYQAMPKAINYASFSNTKKENNDNNDEIDVNSSNDIFDIAKEYLNKHVDYCELYKKFKANNKLEIKDKNEYKEFEKDKENKDKYLIKDKSFVPKNEREFNAIFTNSNINQYTRGQYKGMNKYMYNYAWLKYSKGLADAINFLNLNRDKEEPSLKTLINTVNNSSNIKNLKNYLKINFYDKISYMAETLSYDFFKEIGCRNLLKDDVHIVAIYEHLFGNKNNLVTNMLEWCEAYSKDKCNNGKDTYYIDKILWLCCTGAFYEDDIIITSMNRKNFFDYYDAKTKNKK